MGIYEERPRAELEGKILDLAAKLATARRDALMEAADELQTCWIKAFPYAAMRPIQTWLRERAGGE